MIVQLFISMMIIMAITRDSDIPILAGDGFIAVKDYTKDGKMTMVSTCKATLERAMKYIPEESKGKVQLVDAVCPIFEGVKSRKLRALIMVALGCDVYKSGIKGAGPKKLKQQMDKLKADMNTEEANDEEKFFHKMMKHVAKKTHLGRKAIDALVKGIIYEPTKGQGLG